MNRLFLCMSLAFLGMASQCHAAQFISVKIKNRLFTKIELAKTPAQQKTGLMNRTSLPQDGGMLFIFDTPHILTFWMKNTRIPLDIIFLDSQGVVTAVHSMKVEPPQQNSESEYAYSSRLPSYSSGTPAQFALEINAGLINAMKIRPGDKISLNIP